MTMVSASCACTDSHCSATYCCRLTRLCCIGTIMVQCKYPVEMLKYNLSLLWSSAAPPPPQCAMQRREATKRKEPLVTTT